MEACVVWLPGLDNERVSQEFKVVQEALQLYSKIKAMEPQGKVDTSVHSALLGLLVGEYTSHLLGLGAL
jgi:hypothetical protein